MTAWEMWGVAVPYLGNFVSVLLVLAILSGRKEARATLGWLLLVLFLPFVGAVLYLVFGRVPFPLPPRRGSAEDDQCPLPPPDLPELMTRATKITGTAPVRCRHLELLPSAASKYQRLFADIEAARERVFICYYVFRRDDTGRRLLKLLARKAAQGLEVRLLYDGWGAFGLNLFGGLAPYRARGVRTAPFHPVVDPLAMSRVNFRNHRKIVAIDGRIGYTGSINIGDEYLGRRSRFGAWKDMHVRLEGEAVTALEAIFLEDWHIATGETVPASPAPAAGDDVWVHVLPTGPNRAGDNLFPLLFAQFSAARESIDVLTPYLIPDPGLVAALCVAARQGVRVRALVPGRSNHPMVAAAGRSYYDELLDGGVALYETRQGMLHAKGVLVDGRWALLGSTNLDNRSFHLNFEVNLATSDPGLCQTLGCLVDEWLVDTIPITRERLARRSLVRRLIEGACRTLSPVL